MAKFARKDFSYYYFPHMFIKVLIDQFRSNVKVGDWLRNLWTKSRFSLFLKLLIYDSMTCKVSNKINFHKNTRNNISLMIFSFCRLRVWVESKLIWVIFNHNKQCLSLHCCESSRKELDNCTDILATIPWKFGIIYGKSKKTRHWPEKMAIRMGSRS